MSEARPSGASNGRRPPRAARDRPRDRMLAWLVTGPLGRGLSFAVDFLAALRTVLARRLR